ncbi:hypothetical protein [Burkholderia alba]|uniref:hypothetical protein n=1 Tax=Burkholderia alba TaxID=2683677 RepID=UPI002B055D62|nr:hypothetical protein [Burkholderia alba]
MAANNAPRLWQDITVIDNLLPPDAHAAVYQFLSTGQWSHGWRSRTGAGAQPFWHWHFTREQNDRHESIGTDPVGDLTQTAPLIHTLWRGCQKFRVQGGVENHTDGRLNRSS